MNQRITLGLLMMFMICACTVGPDYQKPNVITPIHFKEEPPKGWKIAEPQDACDRGEWWMRFQDPILNSLEQKLNISNQNIVAAIAQYQQARALVSQARAAYFPILSTMGTFTRRQLPSLIGAGPSTNITTVRVTPPFDDYNLSLDASWEPDLWGSVRRTVEGSIASAQASAAQIAVTQLSAQASMAQFYFQLRGLDASKKTLHDSVNNYQKLLKIVKNQYQAGTASKADILQVQSQLEAVQVQEMDIGIARGQYEHAVAVLIGIPPANLTLEPLAAKVTIPVIPVGIPSALLERRPDIAEAERLVSQANAQIGVAIAAYFPSLTLTGIRGYESNLLENLFSKPAQYWSVAAALAQTLFDGGLRNAQVAAARANYDNTVAKYRQTVLTAFAEVEDNLCALRILQAEEQKQAEAVNTAKRSLELTLAQYQAGTVPLSNVLTAEITYFNATKAANDIVYRRAVAAVGLIKALGGGWDAAILEKA